MTLTQQEMQGYKARRDHVFKNEWILFMNHFPKSHSSVLLHYSPDGPWPGGQSVVGKRPLRHPVILAGQGEQFGVRWKTMRWGFSVKTHSIKLSLVSMGGEGTEKVEGGRRRAPKLGQAAEHERPWGGG